MKIVTLIENQTENELSCEHGLAFYVEYNGKSYLLDAGQSHLFADNAKKLGIDLATVDVAVLSHAHYDHANGFAAFADLNRHAEIYMQSASVNQCYSEKPTGLKDIGISSKVREAIENRVRYVDGDARIDEGVYLVAHHAEGLAKRGHQMHMLTKIQDEMRDDDFAHEQSLVFELPDGIIVLNSCCHGGVDLIIEEAEKAFGGKRILAMIGGFHLMGSDGPDSMRESEEQVCALGEKLGSLQVDMLYTGHCTGTKAFPILKEILGDRLQLLVTGKIIEI